MSDASQVHLRAAAGRHVVTQTTPGGDETAGVAFPEHSCTALIHWVLMAK